MIMFQKTFELFYPNNLKSNDQAAEHYYGSKATKSTSFIPLMVQKSGKPVEVGNLFHYLQGFNCHPIIYEALPILHHQKKIILYSW